MTRNPASMSIAFACILLTTVAGAASNTASSPANLFGFGSDSSAGERTLEQRFDALIDANDQREWLREMSSQPNHVGSPHDRANAEFMLAKFREWGWDAHIETFSVLYPTPKHESLQMVAPTAFTAKLAEPPLPGDATSSVAGALPPYNVYGGDGDVTAGLVYLNYGMPEDYRLLARLGIDVRGKIVIARYGGGWRGLKPKLAQEHGAVGCLIYSDPQDDGYVAGGAYPKGAWRPEDGVQRGSVADTPTYPGDPLTPGVGATADAKRLALSDAKTILKIPVLPISWGDALPLLKTLDGPMAPRPWRGGLPIAYHVGTGTTKVRLVVQSDWQQKTIYDVIAMMKGSREPEQWIVRGNHHDGWVFGAGDPLSGNVAMMSEIKAIGALAKQGWRPQRSLVYASWDGEEPGLLGSTEWVETHAQELQEKAVMYINSDSNGRGFLNVGGSHSLQHLVNEVAAGVDDPETHASVRERMRAKMLMEGAEGDASPHAKYVAGMAEKGGDLPIDALGSGSDYGPFLEHLGIASLNLEFSGEEEQGGVYHSLYDSFDHYIRFGDPDFAYGAALSKVAGHIALRMVDADVLPMRYGDFGTMLERYVVELHDLVDTTRRNTALNHELLDRHVFALIDDPTRPLAPPERESDMPAIDLAPLEQAVKRLGQSAAAFDAAYAARIDASNLSPSQRQAVDAAMGRMEQALTDRDGLPTREWFKHMIYAPGLLTGYAVKTVPGVREALEERHWDEAGHYIGVTARVLDGYSTQLDALTAMLKQ